MFGQSTNSSPSQNLWVAHEYGDFHWLIFSKIRVEESLMKYHLWMLLLGMECILLDRALSNSISRATRTPEKFIITEGIYLSYQRTTNLSRHHPPKAVFSTAHRHLNYETNKNFLKESVKATVGKYTYVHVGVLLKRATVSADRPPTPQVQQNWTFTPYSFFRYFWINYRPALWKILLQRWKYCMVEIPS